MQGFRSYSSYRRQRHKKSPLSGLIKSVLITISFILLLQVFFFQTIIIKTNDMLPEYERGDRYISFVYGVKNPFTNKYISTFRTPFRGEVVVANPGYLKETSAFYQNLDFFVRLISFQQLSLNYGQEHVTASVILRIAGLPGDTFKIEKNIVYVIPQGATDFSSEFDLSKETYSVDKGELPENWLETDPLGVYMEPLILGENEYFLIADNRMSTHDSRFWGPLPIESFKSRVAFKFWPLNFFNFKE